MARNFAYMMAGCACLSLACASDRSPESNDAGTQHGAASEHALTIAFNPMYSAYDGDLHKFRVPVRVIGAEGELTVRTSPGGFVYANATSDGVMLTTRRAGRVTVSITDGVGKQGRAELIVTANEPGDVELGQDRYENQLDGTGPDAGALDAGDIFANLRDADGGFVFPEGGLGGFPSPVSRRVEPPCAFCHQREAAGDSLQTAGDYTPQQTAGLSDQELVAIIVEGEKPEGASFRNVTGGGLLSQEAAANVFRRFHAFELDAVTQRGLIAYLRQLPSMSRAELDFGGLYPGRTK